MEFAVLPGRTYLIEADEWDNDALIEILDPAHELLARADHPERRTGTRRALVTVANNNTLVTRVIGKETSNVSGSATVRIFDLTPFSALRDCLTIFRTLVAADTDYAAGEEISRGHGVSGTASAREAYARAAERYRLAERELTAASDRALRGETALALAAVEYFNLQDWEKTVEWATAAAGLLADADPYRKARADALLAAAWIEIGSKARPAGQAAAGTRETDLLEKADDRLRALSRFHLQRGEKYDAGLQLTNIGIVHLYQGRYDACVSASLAAARLFESIHETPRQALAWQNQALCLWGLGRLQDALSLFERVLGEVGPEPFPAHYLGVLNNTALLDYALGHFDEALRLFDRALVFAEKTQARRDEAQSLYGIGVTYYALGDHDRAQNFLERALAMRTVALDGRGRMATLRALATVDAERGRVEDAIALDREALSLALAPSAVGRIRIQLAAHTAAAGQLEEAEAQLDDVLRVPAKTDPHIQAEARLRRAVVRRLMDRPREAFSDLAIAQPRLHEFGTVTEEFEADLEQARDLQLLGQDREALAAARRTLALSNAVRLQTANPELRAQLQTPLRPAYDLTLELLRARYDHAVAEGREAEAEQLARTAFTTADVSRAHSFADVSAQEYSPAVRSSLAPEFRQREELYRELAGRRFALDSRLDRSGLHDPRAKHLIGDIAELERELDVVNTRIATRAANAGGRAGSGKMSTGLPALPPDTALVSYWLGSDSAYAWVVSGSGVHWIRLSQAASIQDKAVSFHRALASIVDVPIERRLEEGRLLYEMIVRPMEPWLSEARQWVVIPDGALDYVPFAALRTSGAQGYVASQHDVSLTPAAWMLNGQQPHPEPRDRRSLLLVADPVYQEDDPRLTALAAPHASSQRGPDPDHREYQRLPYTAREAAEILAEFPPAEVDELIGLNATRERLLGLDWSKYRYIHIATHGIVDAEVPQLSALMLGSYNERGYVGDGAVRVADLSLKTLSADVAVFSACDTALGKEVLSEGLVGIGFTTLARGSKAVVASLWPVPDEMGARLMTEFYRHLLHDAMSPPASLGAAMRSVLSRDASADPGLWAAFQVSVAALPGAPPPRGSGTPKVFTATKH